MKTLRNVFAFFSLALLASATTWADDWPRFLGPAGTGVSGEESPKDLPEEGPEVLWEKEIGTGVSSIAIANGKLFSAGQLKDGEDTVFCLDPATGKELWTFNYEAELDDNLFEGGPTATPTVDGDQVFALARAGQLFCLRTDDGKAIWETHLVKDLGGEKPTWGFSGSPVIAGSRLLVEGGGQSAVIALAKDSGKLEWKSGSSKAGYAPPTILRIGSTESVLAFHGDSLAAYRMDDGKQLWREPWKTDYDINAASPVVAGNLVFVGSGYGTGSAVFKVSDESAEEIWRLRDFGCQLSTPLLVDNHLIGFHTQNLDRTSDNMLVSREWATGKLVWKESLETGTVIRVGDQILALTQKGELLSLQANPKAYTERGRAQILTGRTWAPPAFSNGILFARTNRGKLVAVRMR